MWKQEHKNEKKYLQDSRDSIPGFYLNQNSPFEINLHSCFGTRTKSGIKSHIFKKSNFNKNKEEFEIQQKMFMT